MKVSEDNPNRIISVQISPPQLVKEAEESVPPLGESLFCSFLVLAFVTFLIVTLFPLCFVIFSGFSRFVWPIITGHPFPLFRGVV